MGKLSRIKQKSRKHIHKKLIFRLRIFALILTVIVGIVAYKIFNEEINLSLATLGFVLGTGIGVIFGRMLKIYWHPETEKIITSLDKTAIGLLIIYLVIEFGRKWFFSHWLQGTTLNAFVLIFAAGLLLGRLLAMIKNIRKILKAKNPTNNTKNPEIKE